MAARPPCDKGPKRGRGGFPPARTPSIPREEDPAHARLDQAQQMIETGKTYLIPGAYDGLSCRICQNVGAEIIYATGGGIARGPASPIWA